MNTENNKSTEKSNKSNYSVHIGLDAIEEITNMYDKEIADLENKIVELSEDYEELEEKYKAIRKKCDDYRSGHHSHHGHRSSHHEEHNEENKKVEGPKEDDIDIDPLFLAILLAAVIDDLYGEDE